MSIQKNPQTDRDFRYYLCGRTNPDETIPASELSDAFVEGYLAALRSHRIYDDALTMCGHNLHVHVFGDLLFNETKVEDSLRTKSRRIVKDFDDRHKEKLRDMAMSGTPCIGDKRRFRGMVFGCAALGHDGCELDPITLDHTNEHHPWPDTVFVHKASGIIPDLMYYYGLTAEQQAEYVETRRYGTVLFTDIETMSKLIAEDLNIGDPDINRLYLIKAGNPDSELYVFRDVIAATLQSIEHAKMPTPTMTAKIPNPTPTKRGHSHSYK